MDDKKLKKDYQFLIEHFGQEKIISGYDCLYQLMTTYLKRKQLESKVCLAPAILDHVVVDRLYTAQNIELMIMAFDAGRNYQYCVDVQK